jgi:hypothetical protein
LPSFGALIDRQFADRRDSEIFNKFVRNITAVHTRRIVMSSIDRVSGAFLAVMFGGAILLCGSLLFATLGQ